MSATMKHFGGVAMGLVMAASGSNAMAADNQPDNVEHFTTGIHNPSTIQKKYSYLKDGANLVIANTACGPEAVVVHTGVKDGIKTTRFDLAPVPDAFRSMPKENLKQADQIGTADVHFNGGKLVYDFDAHALSAAWLKVIPKDADVVHIDFHHVNDCQHSGSPSVTPPNNNPPTDAHGGCNGAGACGTGNEGQQPDTSGSNGGNGGNTSPGPNGGAGAGPAPTI